MRRNGNKVAEEPHIQHLSLGMMKEVILELKSVLEKLITRK